MAEKKITDLANKAVAADTDIIPIVDPADNTTKRTTVGGLISALLSVIPGGSLLTAMFADNAVTFSKIDATSWDDVAFEAANAGTVNSTNSTPQTLATINVTVTKTTKVLCTGVVSASSTADTEFTPSMTLDGANVKTGAAGAIIATTSSRFVSRSMSAIYELTPGTHAIVLRVAGSSGTLSVPAGRGQLTTSLAQLG